MLDPELRATRGAGHKVTASRIPKAGINGERTYHETAMQAKPSHSPGARATAGRGTPSAKDKPRNETKLVDITLHGDPALVTGGAESQQQKKGTWPGAYAQSINQSHLRTKPAAKKEAPET